MKAETAEVGNSGGAADHGQIALVEIVERLNGPAAQAIQNGFGGVPAFLHRDRCDAWKVVQGSRVSGYEDLGMAGYGEVGLDANASSLVTRRPGRLRQGSDKTRDAHSGCPNYRARFDLFFAFRGDQCDA